jgi:hypothetical protein
MKKFQIIFRSYNTNTIKEVLVAAHLYSTAVEYFKANYEGDIVAVYRIGK